MDIHEVSTYVLRQELKRRTGNKAEVFLFKPGGKYYTTEWWEIPPGAIGPDDMDQSPDYRTISGGPVLVVTQEPWGFPHLLNTLAKRLTG